MKKQKQKLEYGDFQTPPALAEAAITTLRRLGIKPKAVLEPTCGQGAFLLAAVQAFSDVSQFIGLDINQQYLKDLELRISHSERRESIQLIRGDFFFFDWSGLLSALNDPVLIIGNPPWVTSSELSRVVS